MDKKECAHRQVMARGIENICLETIGKDFSTGNQGETEATLRLLLSNVKLHFS